MRLPIDLSDDLRTGSFNRSKPTALGGWLVPLWAIPRQSSNTNVVSEDIKKEPQDEKE